jgi:anti-anti-sigma factor
MDLSEVKRGGVFILGLKGKLDAETSTGLSDKLMDLIERGERRFVLDGSELVYMSSSGLKVLLQAAKRLISPQGKIVLCSLNGRIKRVFDITGFSSIFAVYDSQIQATEGLQEWQ